MDHSLHSLTCTESFHDHRHKCTKESKNLIGFKPLFKATAIESFKDQKAKTNHVLKQLQLRHGEKEKEKAKKQRDSIPAYPHPHIQS